MSRSERSVEKEAFWRAKLDEQRQSGLNVRAFCRVRSISEPSFYAWRRALAARDAEDTASDSEKAGTRRERIAALTRQNRRGKQRLIPVEVVSAQREPVLPVAVEGNQRLELVTPGGFTLRFAADAPSDTLARLLDIVARCTTEGISAC
jgi:transposase-like protein